MLEKLLEITCALVFIFAFFTAVAIFLLVTVEIPVIYVEIAGGALIVDSIVLVLLLIHDIDKEN